MTKHMTGTREEWLASRLELLEAEKELKRRSDGWGGGRSCRGGSTRSTDSRPASSFGSDFNFDFSVGFTEEQQRKEGIEYNYHRETPWQLRGGEGLSLRYPRARHPTGPLCSRP